MRKDNHIRFLIVSLSIVVVLCAISVAYSQTYTVVQVTNNTYGEFDPQINDSGHMVWIGYLNNHYQIFFYDGSTITQLTSNDGVKSGVQINNSDHVVWDEQVLPTNYEIFLWDGSSIKNISNNEYPDYYPQINDHGDVVWHGSDGTDYEIFLYNDFTKTKIKLTDNSYYDRNAQINDDGDVVWIGSDGIGQKVFLWDGISTTQLGDDFCCKSGVQINNNGQVVWQGWTTFNGTISDTEIFLSDGSSSTVEQITNNDYNDSFGSVGGSINDNGYITWFGDTSKGREIFFYDGDTVHQITNSTYGKSSPKINNIGNITWWGYDPQHFAEIFLFDGHEVHQLTDDGYFKQRARINASGQLAWQGHDSEDYEIFLAVPNVDSDDDGIPDDQDACPNEDATGFDIDEDGCIDNMTGLAEMLETLVTEGIIAEELQNSLLSKVGNAEKSADKENICAAVNKLEALINEVNAQKGKKISDDAADLIIEYTNSVISWLLDQLPPDESC